MPFSKQDINLILASKLDILRRYNRLKPYQMAEILGVNSRTYLLIEGGRLSLSDENISKICKYFKLKESDFIKHRNKLKSQNHKTLQQVPYLEDLITALLGELRSIREEKNMYIAYMAALISAKFPQQ
jgi:transcriptional regulator with XRE-family HTH domain